MEQNQRDSIPCQRLQPLLEYHMQPFYMLKGIPDPEFTLMEKNMSLNLSLVKMPHSNFKKKATEFEAGIVKFNDAILLQITSFVYECVIILLLSTLETSLEVSITCTILVLVSLKEVIYLLYDVVQLNMDYALWIILVFGSGILFRRKSEAQIHFQILRKKLKAICYHFIDHN